MFVRTLTAAALALSPALPLRALPTPADSIALVRARAVAGDADAQNDLGGRLMAANDPAQLREARQWFRRASGAGHAEAMNNFATMLLMGVGGPADEAEGRRLRDLAAQRGSVGANLSIAERYIRGGEGYPRDAARGLAHVRAAAESSSSQAGYAQWRLGMMHLQGLGTPADPAEAYRWVVRAADNGVATAMVSRAVMLATGEGVAEDDVGARSWYQRAAESGDVQFAHAMRGLGAMLATGEGGPIDLPRGIAYLRIAKAGNDRQAGTLLESWRDRITPEVDRQAWEIANRWMAEHMTAEGDR
jgi:TPR repeat protein